MQNNVSGKRDTLTADWLNIWKHSNKQTKVFPNVVSETLTPDMILYYVSSNTYEVAFLFV